PSRVLLRGGDPGQERRRCGGRAGRGRRGLRRSEPCLRRRRGRLGPQPRDPDRDPARARRRDRVRPPAGRAGGDDRARSPRRGCAGPGPTLRGAQRGEALVIRLAEACVRRPVFATMLVLVFVVLGAISYTRLGVSLYPNIDIPYTFVSTVLKGASVEEIETRV